MQVFKPQENLLLEGSISLNLLMPFEKRSFQQGETNSGKTRRHLLTREIKKCSFQT